MNMNLRFRQKKMFNLEREPCWAWVVVILREVGVKKIVYANGSISGKFEQNILVIYNILRYRFMGKMGIHPLWRDFSVA